MKGHLSISNFLTSVVLLLSTNVLGATVSLLEMPNARPASLGEAFSAATDDISALSFNPASLRTLSQSQASFLYEQGLAEDTYGQLMVGTPRKKWSVGGSVGYYDGGSIEIFDGKTEKTVSAKKDMAVSVGIATKAGRLSYGLSGKYISSQLIEAHKATAYAADLGVQASISSRLSVGAAVQNLGSKLKYLQENVDLPQIARAGASFSLLSGAYKSFLSVEAPYYMNEGQFRPGVGLEIATGPLALRAGYRSGGNIESLTLGAGFLMSGLSIDYSYGLVQDLQASHKISVGLKFGSQNAINNPISQKKENMLTQINSDRSLRRGSYE